MQKHWIPDSRKTIICIDSYDDGVLQGRICCSSGSTLVFPSLSRFLVLMEDLLQQNNEPQSDTIPRSFSSFLVQSDTEDCQRRNCRGALATFELQLLFRQHTSWQGVLHWRDQRKQQSFRSVLELILLMDSALRERICLETA